MKNLVNNKFYDNLLIGARERFNTKPLGPEPDFDSLQAVIAGKKVDSAFVDTLPESIRGAFRGLQEAIARVNGDVSADIIPIADDTAKKPKSGKKFVRRKAMYNTNFRESDEDICRKLDDLLQKSEIEGLDLDEMAEVNQLMKKVR